MTCDSLYTLSFFCFILTHALIFSLFFFFNDTATTEIYPLSLHDALPICRGVGPRDHARPAGLLEGVLLLLGAGRPLEREARGPCIAQVPDVAVHTLLPRPARVHDDGVALGVRHRDDHAATPLPPALFALARAPRAPFRRGRARIERRLQVVVERGAGGRVGRREPRGREPPTSRAHADLRRPGAEG